MFSLPFVAHAASVWNPGSKAVGAVTVNVPSELWVAAIQLADEVSNRKYTSSTGGELGSRPSTAVSVKDGEALVVRLPGRSPMLTESGLGWAVSSCTTPERDV